MAVTAWEMVTVMSEPMPVSIHLAGYVGGDHTTRRTRAGHSLPIPTKILVALYLHNFVATINLGLFVAQRVRIQVIFCA